MRAWTNLNNMKDLTCLVMRRGFQLSALLLLLGCWAILKGSLDTADTFRQLSSTVLLLTVLGTAYIETHSL